MKPSPKIAAVVAVLAASAVLVPDAIGFHPAESSVVAKRFSTSCEVVLDDLRIDMNGEQADPATMGLPSDLSISFGYLVECSDEYVAVSSGRPKELLRTFDTFEGWFVDPEGVETREDEGLEGQVRFTWNEEDEVYERELVGEEDADEERLAVLAEDLDLRGLLPEGDVDEGDEWDVSGSDLMSVLLPGFDVAAALEQGDTDLPDELLDTLTSLFQDSRATCTYAGTEEVDGETCAVLSIECILSDDVSIDPSSLAEGGAGLGEATFDLALDLEIEGRCLWDSRAGRFHSLEMEGYGTITLDVAADVEEMGLVLEGSAEFSIDFTREATAK